MSESITPEQYQRELSPLLDEAFERAYGIFLDRDRGMTLFETLDGISAEEASQPVGANCSTIAAQVEHIRFYLDQMLLYLAGQQRERPDWQDIWRTVSAVTPEEWHASKGRLRETYGRLRAEVSAYDDWTRERAIGGSIALVAHTAFHLGEIWRSLCVLRSPVP